MSLTTCSKRYIDIPFAHRQHTHKGHCSLIHGHNWSFEFTFGAHYLDACGFVVDFGDLKWLKAWLEETFDHALVLNQDDPDLEYLKGTLVGRHGAKLAKLTIVPNCGAEGLADFIAGIVGNLILAKYDGRVFLASLTVEEDSKNKATLILHTPNCSHA